MKTLYVLAFACLSLPALADVLEPIGVGEENTVVATAPAPQPIEDQSVGGAVYFLADGSNAGATSDDVAAVTASDDVAAVTSPNDVAAVTPPDDVAAVATSDDVAAVTSPHDAAAVTAPHDQAAG